MRELTLTLGTNDFILQLDRGIGNSAFRQLGDNIATWLAAEGIAVVPVNDECDSALGKYVYATRASQWKPTVATTLKAKLPVWFSDDVELHITGLK